MTGRWMFRKKRTRRSSDHKRKRVSGDSGEKDKNECEKESGLNDLLCVLKHRKLESQKKGVIFATANDVLDNGKDEKERRVKGFVTFRPQSDSDSESGGVESKMNLERNRGKQSDAGGEFHKDKMYEMPVYLSRESQLANVKIPGATPPPDIHKIPLVAESECSFAEKGTRKGTGKGSTVQSRREHVEEGEFQYFRFPSTHYSAPGTSDLTKDQQLRAYFHEKMKRR